MRHETLLALATVLLFAMALVGGGIYVAGRADSRLKKVLDTGDELTGYLTLVAVFFGGALLIGNSDYDLAAALIVPLTYSLALTVKEQIDGVH